MRILIPIFVSAAVLFTACGSDKEKENAGKVKLSFQPQKDKAVKVNYFFSVNSVSSQAITSFDMKLSGKGETDASGNVMLEFTNDDISMDADIQGQKVKGSAIGPDSVTGDMKLVAMPVFSLVGKKYRSMYSSQMDKQSEVQLNSDGTVDSIENKMQLLVRYPDHEVAVGDSWEKSIVIKSGNKMNCMAKYTLKELKGDIAVISIEGKLDGKGESFGNEFTIDGKLSGMFTVSITTGWPLETTVEQDFSLKMGGKDLPMKYSIKSKIE